MRQQLRPESPLPSKDARQYAGPLCDERTQRRLYSSAYSRVVPQHAGLRPADWTQPGSEIAQCARPAGLAELSPISALTSVLGRHRRVGYDKHRRRLFSADADTRQRDNPRVAGAPVQRLCAKHGLHRRVLTQCRGHLNNQMSGRALGSDVMFDTTGRILSDHHAITCCTASSRARG